MSYFLKLTFFLNLDFGKVRFILKKGYIVFAYISKMLKLKSSLWQNRTDHLWFRICIDCSSGLKLNIYLFYILSCLINVNSIWSSLHSVLGLIRFIWLIILNLFQFIFTFRRHLVYLLRYNSPLFIFYSK